MLVLLFGTACVTVPSTSSHKIEQITHQGQSIRFTQMIDQLASSQAVLVGEKHTRLDHHLTQLAITKALYQRNPNLAIGVEWFQQDFQSVLDRYIAGTLSESDMLRQTEYYERWRYDYRLYRPIMAFARKHKIPVLALNAPSEITRKIGEGGLSVLTPAQRQQLPALITPPSEGYRQQLHAIFKHHQLPEDRIEHFITVQRVWDETMAANSLKFLQANPNSKLVIMAGVGHIAHDDGIGKSIQRAMPKSKVSRIASIDADKTEEGIPVKAEYLIQSKAIELPPTGKLGVMLDTKSGRLMITQVKEKGAAEQAGLQKNDKLLQVDGKPIHDMTDLKLAIGTAKLGRTINVLIEREHQSMAFNVVLK